MIPTATFKQTLNALKISPLVIKNILSSTNKGGEVIINNLVPEAYREEVLDAWDLYLAMSGRAVYPLATNK